MELFDIPLVGLFLFLLPCIAFLYASVGHGGASGYLALMALFSFSPEMMKPPALLLNLYVAAIAFFHYYKKGFFNKKLFFSFAVTSIPFAFIGGMMTIDIIIYKKILGAFLIFAILKLLGFFDKENKILNKVTLWQGLLIGTVIGFTSGLIGIGGGIILTPIILLMNWGEMKEAAAVSALFICVNSAAGLAGLLYRGAVVDKQVFILVGLAIAGGYTGAYLGSHKLDNKLLRKLLAFILFIACIKLFLR